MCLEELVASTSTGLGLLADLLACQLIKASRSIIGLVSLICPDFIFRGVSVAQPYCPLMI